MTKRYKVVKPVRFFLFVLIVTMALVIFISTLFTGSETEASSMDTFVQVELSESDSIWTIASEYCNDSQDIRDFIKDIKDVNDISSADTLHPGDKIFVPIYE